jgi:hypothetical protein
MSVTVRFFDDGKQEAVVMKHSIPKFHLDHQSYYNALYINCYTIIQVEAANLRKVSFEYDCYSYPSDMS